MKTDALEQHIINTVKEWQMKIGYRKETMKLYYPEESLKRMFGLPADSGEPEMYEALAQFVEREKEKLGTLVFSNEKERYCIQVPEEGCAYIHKSVPDYPFLKRFLQVIQKMDSTMEDVVFLFSEYAREQGTVCEIQNREPEGLGVVFRFADARVDDAVYCVEDDEFGLTYHRFTADDYEILLHSGGHAHGEGV